MERDIIILGCGISGMLTALGLAKNNINSTIIEKKSIKDLTNPDDPRTTALNDSSKHYMEKIDIWQTLQEHCQNINDIYVCQNMNDNMFHMTSEGIELGRMIENNILRRSLFRLVKDNKHITLITDAEYKDLNLENGYVQLNVEKHSKDNNNQILSTKTPYKATLCIAADGKFSEARKSFFHNQFEKNYGQKALAFNIKHELNHEGGAIEHFLPRGPFATLPLKSGYESSIVWTEDDEFAAFLEKLSQERVEDQIYKLTGGALGKVKISTPIKSFPLSAHVVEKYHEKMLALIADSAHCIHPLAGQGINMGIGDVICLVDLITEHMSLGLKIDENMLVKYEQKRKRDNIIMFRVTDIINNIFTSKSKIINMLSSSGLSLLEQFPFIKNILINYAKGIK